MMEGNREREKLKPIGARNMNRMGQMQGGGGGGDDEQERREASTSAGSPKVTGTSSRPTAAPKEKEKEEEGGSCEEGERLLSNEYVLSKELGAGGFSTVRLATHRVSGQQVAVKTLHKMSSDVKGHLDADDLAMIRNEVMIVSYLFENMQHPNVVKLVDIFEEDAKVHLVQELCKGGELFYRIELKLIQAHELHKQMRQKKIMHNQESALFSERDAAEIIFQVASGLHELHKHGIIHRDMKPENLLYETESKDSKIKITDFGLSYKQGTDDPMKSRLLGSIDYIAPEVLTRRCYTKAGDMWSVGVITYILLSGSPPFAAHNTTSKLQKIIRCDYHFSHQIWKKISNPAKHLITQLLVLDPQKRFSCADVLKHPWVTGTCRYPEIQLTDTLEGIKAFNAKRKFRAAALACIHIHRAKVKNLHKKFETLGGSSLIGENIGSMHFSQEELQDLKKEFQQSVGQCCNRENKGSIGFKCFQDVMMRRLRGSQDDSASAQTQNNALLHRLFELFDTDGDGAIDFREFITGLGSMQADAGEGRIKMCFKTYDVDDSGYISKDELFEMLASVTLKKEVLVALISLNVKQSPTKKRKFSPQAAAVIDSPTSGETDSLHSTVARNTSLHAEVLGDLFERLDANNDGQISYEEFKEGISKDPFLVDVLFGSA